MADWSDIQFNAGQTDYITRLNALLSRAQSFATEVENGRLGSPSLQTQIASRLNQAEVDARIVALSPTYVGGLTQNFNANARRIFSLADPVNPQDAATRAWVLSVVTAGGDPSGIPVTSFNVGTMADAQVLTRSGTGLVGRTITPGSARVSVTVSAGAITIDVPAGTFATLASANTWAANQTFTGVRNAIQGSAPSLFFLENDVAADSRVWRLQVNGSAFQLALGNDAEDAFSPVLTFVRNGMTVISAAFSCDLSDQFGSVRMIRVRTSNANTNITRADRGGTVRKDNSTAYTFTIRDDATEGWIENETILVCNDGLAGDLILNPVASVTIVAGIVSGAVTIPPGDSRLVQRVGPNSWRAR